MKFDKLVKKAKKELTRNGKKSAALGLCCLVAAWFWAPLLAKWMGLGSPTPAAAPAAASTAPATAPAGASSAIATAKSVALKWNEIMELIQKDSRAATANVDFQRDPFSRVLPPPGAPEDEAKEHTAAPTAKEIAAVTPQSAGLVLTGTLLGTHSGVATISGRAYRLGEAITPRTKSDEQDNNSAPPPALQFKLVEVHSNRVVLARGESRFELTMKEPELANGNQIYVNRGNAETN